MRELVAAMTPDGGALVLAIMLGGPFMAMVVAAGIIEWFQARGTRR